MIDIFIVSSCCCSVAQSCQTLCNPMDSIRPGLSVPQHLPKFAHVHVHCIGFTIQLSHLLMFPSPSALNLSQHWGFSSESAVCIKWPKYWSFSFRISPSNEYSGLISLKIDWFDLLDVQGTLRSLLQHHSSKTSILKLYEYLYKSSCLLFHYKYLGVEWLEHMHVLNFKETTILFKKKTLPICICVAW